MNIGFTRIMSRGAELLSNAHAHPFNQQLHGGTLLRNTFEFYLEQDALYLREFSQVLNMLSQRFADRRYALQFRQLSNEIVESELNLHLRYLRHVRPSGFFSPPTMKKIPVISRYTEHLLNTVKTAPIEASVASCIPCFWVYNNLGMKMQASCSVNNPYRNWIASYSSERFTTSTSLIVQAAVELTSPIRCELLHEHIARSFLKSLHYELQFFDAAFAGRHGQLITTEKEPLRLQK